MFSVFFFFKQKTAYEMRISDWSSDVCSSDLTMVQPQYIRLSVFPTHTHHGIKIRLLKARVAPVPRSVVMPLPLAPDRASFVVRPASLLDERRVLGTRDMVDACRKIPRDRDSMLRTLMVEAAILRQW